MNITIKLQNNYGNQTAYPICQHALIFAKLAGTKTLTRQTLQLIKSLGYSINIEIAAPLTMGELEDTLAFDYS